MADAFSQSDLEAYLDEALPAEEMARVEKTLRENHSLLGRISLIHSRRSSGIHSLGEIWRHNRLSCPTREQLGSFRLSALTKEEADYVAFHLEVIGCIYCHANLIDLDSLQTKEETTTKVRRRRFFETSVSYLRSR